MEVHFIESNDNGVSTKQQLSHHNAFSCLDLNSFVDVNYQYHLVHNRSPTQHCSDESGVTRAVYNRKKNEVIFESNLWMFL